MRPDRVLLAPIGKSPPARVLRGDNRGGVGSEMLPIRCFLLFSLRFAVSCCGRAV